MLRVYIGDVRTVLTGASPITNSVWHSGNIFSVTSDSMVTSDNGDVSIRFRLVTGIPSTFYFYTA